MLRHDQNNIIHPILNEELNKFWVIVYEAVRLFLKPATAALSIGVQETVLLTCLHHLNISFFELKQIPRPEARFLFGFELELSPQDEKLAKQLLLSWQELHAAIRATHSLQEAAKELLLTRGTFLQLLCQIRRDHFASHSADVIGTNVIPYSATDIYRWLSQQEEENLARLYPDAYQKPLSLDRTDIYKRITSTDPNEIASFRHDFFAEIKSAIDLFEAAANLGVPVLLFATIVEQEYNFFLSRQSDQEMKKLTTFTKELQVVSEMTRTLEKNTDVLRLFNETINQLNTQDQKCKGIVKAEVNLISTIAQRNDSIKKVLVKRSQPVPSLMPGHAFTLNGATAKSHREKQKRTIENFLNEIAPSTSKKTFKKQ